FPETDDRITTQMKSVGEVMAIGRTFQESIQKALRGLEVGVSGFDPVLDTGLSDAMDILKGEPLDAGGQWRWYIADAFRQGWDVETVAELTGIDPWFLIQIEDLMHEEARVATMTLAEIDRDTLFALKRKGFSDDRLASLLGAREVEVQQL